MINTQFKIRSLWWRQEEHGIKRRAQWALPEYVVHYFFFKYLKKTWQKFKILYSWMMTLQVQYLKYYLLGLMEVIWS